MRLRVAMSHRRILLSPLRDKVSRGTEVDKETLVDTSRFTFDKTAIKNYDFILLCYFCMQFFRPISALQFSPGSRSIVKASFGRPGFLSQSWICSLPRNVLAYGRRCLSSWADTVGELNYVLTPEQRAAISAFS